MASEDAFTGVGGVSINHALTDDLLRIVLAMLKREDRKVFGLVCRRWLHLHRLEKRKLRVRLSASMLRKMAAWFPRLLELDFSWCYHPFVTDADLSFISREFPGLRVLDLNHVKGITDDGLSTIGHALPLLQSLDVSFCSAFGDEGFLAIAEGCRDLRSIHLDNSTRVTDKALQYFSSNCPNLEDLSLQGCFFITDDGLRSLVRGCRRIKALNVSGCVRIGDHGISTVSQASSSSLKVLKFLECSHVGDESILCLSKFCQNLETLAAKACRRITDESVMSLAVACSHGLKQLWLSSCLNITDASVNCILGRCSKLEALDIENCEKVTDGAFRDVGDWPDLKVLKVGFCAKLTVSGIGLVLGSCEALQLLDVRCCPKVSMLCCVLAGLQFPKSCRVVFDQH